MPGIARKNDVCTGHGCYPSRANSSWASRTFVNGREIHRQGDSWSAHC